MRTCLFCESKEKMEQEATILAQNPMLAAYCGGGGGGGGAVAKACFTETTVVPAMRSKYLWRGSGPGVAMPIRKSMRKRSQ